jgi:hypothetical protein
VDAQSALSGFHRPQLIVRAHMASVGLPGP